MKLKSLNLKSFNFFNMLALSLVKSNVNSYCMWIYHQPEFPAEARKYSKIK